MRHLTYYLPGSMLILLALVILAFPQILVAFVAALIMMLGIGAIYMGHAIRKSEREFQRMNGWFSDNDPIAWRFLREPIFRDFFQYR